MIEARPRWVSTAAALAAGVVPVLGWLWEPASPTAAVLARSLAIVAALHGLGRLAASYAGDEHAPAGLALVLGLAVYLGLAGLLLAVGAFGPGARTGLIVAGCILGSGWLARNADRVADRIGGLRARGALIAAACVAGAGVVVLAAAGHWQAPFVDADADYLGQIRRLADTGALEDAVGFPRTAGLGGQLALAALVDTLDSRTAHLVDRGVLFLIAVILVVTGARRAHGIGLAVFVLPLLLLAIPAFPDDSSPRWSLVVLVLGAAAALERARARQAPGGAALVVLVIAASVTLRHAAAAFAIVMCAELWRTSRGWAHPPRWRPIVVIGAAIILPYLIAMAGAVASGPLDLGLGARYLVGADERVPACLAIGAAGSLLALGTRRLAAGTRFTMLAACASIATAGMLSPSVAATWQYVAAAGIAAVLLFCVAVVGDPAGSEDTPAPSNAARPSVAAVVIVTTALGGALALARFPLGELGTWPTRLAASLDDARALGDATPAAASLEARAYAAAQRSVPAGTRLGIWVARADLVDHRLHEIVDLRTADGRACMAAYRRGRASGACARHDLLMREVGVDLVLVSADALPAPPRLVPDGPVGAVFVVELLDR